MLTSHPFVYTLIYTLINEQNTVESKLVKLRTGVPFRRKPKYILEDQRIQELIASYDKEKNLIFAKS
ncbi:unnamed protein product, partial [Brachionus calyciflorus]